MNKKAALIYNIRRLDKVYILQAAFLRQNNPDQVQRVPASQKLQHADLSSKELPQGLFELVLYCNEDGMSTDHARNRH
jgi:hypothetical protein